METTHWIHDSVKLSKSIIRSKLKKSDLAQRFYSDFDIYRKHGSLRPATVKMKDSNHSIFINSQEPRGRALLRSFCDGQPQLKQLWVRAIEQFSPDIVLDVGVNYGEFLFLPDYKSNAKIFGVEPAPDLKPYLEQSHASHPASSQIHMHYKAAGTTHGGTISFFYDESWSGRSSVLNKNNLKNPTEVLVEQTTVDQLLKDHISNDSFMVFKIDVESYEPEVLAGMTQTISSVSSIGILEYDADQLKQIGRDPGEFLNTLSESFTILSLQSNCEIKVIKKHADLINPTEHADLLVLSDASYIEKLGITVI